MNELGPAVQTDFPCDNAAIECHTSLIDMEVITVWHIDHTIEGMLAAASLEMDAAAASRSAPRCFLINSANDDRSLVVRIEMNVADIYFSICTNSSLPIENRL